MDVCRRPPDTAPIPAGLPPVEAASGLLLPHAVDIGVLGTHDVSIAEATVDITAPADRGADIKTGEAWRSFPEDLDRLVSGSLKPSTLEGNTTEFFDIEGHPELVVRRSYSHNPDRLPRLRAALASSDAIAKEDCIDVLPYRTVEHDDQLYVVTKRVEGTDLDVALYERPEEVSPCVDAVMKGLCDSLMESRQSGKPFPGDVVNCYQYMLGTVEGDIMPRTWLVDLPFWRIEMISPGAFEDVLQDIILEVQKMEEAGKRFLPEARAAIARALPLCQEDVLRYLPTLQRYMQSRKLHADPDAVRLYRY